jgi:hypothetical protein
MRGLVLWLIVIAALVWDGTRAQTLLNPSQIRMQAPTGALISGEALLSQSPDGSYLIPLPVVPTGTTNSAIRITVWALNIFRNNQKQDGGTDYNMDPQIGGRFIPVTPWLPTDTVMVDYWTAATSVSTASVATPAVSAPPAPMRKTWIRRLLKR